MGTSGKQEDLAALETETASRHDVGRPVRRGACAGNNDWTLFTEAQAVGCNC